MRIPNSFLTDFSDTPNEFKAVCFIYSLINPFTATDNDGNYILRIKQETLAKRCYISIATVKRIISNLIQKGFILKAERSVKQNGELGTTLYTVKKHAVNRRYFCITKRSLYMLAGKSFVVYAHCCSSAHKDKFFKSYTTLAEETGYRRSDIIRIIKELVSDGFLAKYKRRTKVGDNTANVYLILRPTFTMFYFAKALKTRLISNQKPETKKSLELFQQSKAHKQNLKKRFSKVIVTQTITFVKRFLKKILKKVNFLH